MAQSINLDLIIPVMMVFLLLRIKSVYNIALRLLCGLRFFMQSRYTAAGPSQQPSGSSTPTADEILERSIAKLGLTMMEVDDSLKSRHILGNQLFYGVYEALINLGVSSLFAYLWSMGYHCVRPEAPQSSWVVFLIAVLGVVSFQSLLQVLYLTGYRAKETKMALYLGIMTFTFSLVMFTANLHFISLSAITAVSIHVNALLMQLYENSPQFGVAALNFAVQIVFSSFLACMAMGMVIPAIRFSQSFSNLLPHPFQAKNQTIGIAAPRTVQFLLLVDLFMPLICCMIFSSLPQMLYNLVLAGYTKNSSDLGTCSAEDGSNTAQCADAPTNSTIFDEVLMCVQLVVVVATGVVRIMCMKKHLQNFLDSIISAVSAQLVAGANVNRQLLQLQVKACSDYLIAAATQYVSIPLFAFAVVLLLHKSSPTGTGICQATYSMLKLDDTSLVASIQYAAQVDTSTLAVETAATPYLTTAIGLFSKESAFEAFAAKMSQIYYLSATPAIAICRSVICVHSLIWFLLYGTSALVWMLKPDLLLGPAAATAVANDSASVPTSASTATDSATNKASE